MFGRNYASIKWNCEVFEKDWCNVGCAAIVIGQLAGSVIMFSFVEDNILISLLPLMTGPVAKDN